MRSLYLWWHRSLRKGNWLAFREKQRLDLDTSLDLREGGHPRLGDVIVLILGLVCKSQRSCEMQHEWQICPDHFHLLSWLSRDYVQSRLDDSFLSMWPEVAQCGEYTDGKKILVDMLLLHLSTYSRQFGLPTSVSLWSFPIVSQQVHAGRFFLTSDVKRCDASGLMMVEYC